VGSATGQSFTFLYFTVAELLSRSFAGRIAPAMRNPYLTSSENWGIAC
jgi:hypothetical protein